MGQHRAAPVINQDGEIVGHYVTCPACSQAGVEEIHVFAAKMNNGTPGWSFNGDLEKPTFSPSMLAQGTYAGKPYRCHSFVRDGKIEYLSDCTHALAGKTVELPAID